jgi:hypothetical protein
MKKRVFGILGIIAMIVVIGFTMAACEEPKEKGPAPGTSMDNPIPLEEGKWVDGELIEDKVTGIYYSFPVETGQTYYVWWDDSWATLTKTPQDKAATTEKTAFVWVNAYYQGPGNYKVFQGEKGWNGATAKIDRDTDTVILLVSVKDVKDFTDYGTFSICYSKMLSRPKF